MESRNDESSTGGMDYQNLMKQVSKLTSDGPDDANSFRRANNWLSIKDEEVDAAVQLRDAVRDGRGDEALRILNANPERIWILDPLEETAVHIAARAGCVDMLTMLIAFLKENTLVKETLLVTNWHGETALHLAVKNWHQEAANCLINAEFEAVSIKDNDGNTPFEVGKKTGIEISRIRFRTLALMSDLEMAIIEEARLGFEDDAIALKEKALLDDAMSDLLWAIAHEDEAKVEQILAANPALIYHSNPILGTLLHVALRFQNQDMVKRLVSHLSVSGGSNSDLVTRVALAEDKYGHTPLQIAIQGQLWPSKDLPHILTRLAPEAAFKIDKKGVSPLYLAVEKGYEDLVRYMFELMPGKNLSLVAQDSLVTNKKRSLPHAALRVRNLGMLQVLMEELPSLINSSNRQGYKPLSFAAHNGFLDEVKYFLKNFPNSATKYDGDGSFPIHKVISRGHVHIVREFLSNCPESLYSIDRKSQSILHIAVSCRQRDVLSYLTNLEETKKIFNLKNDEGKTFSELEMDLKL